MDHHFACSQCGKCCRDLRLTLSVDEAIVWSLRGHPVQVMCEALPWPEADGAPEAQDTGRRYRGERAFAARTGDIPLRIHVTLTAWNQGACPNLRPDQRCGIYADRPRICRIYPLEARPWFALDPARKLCPPEAWDNAHPLLTAEGEICEPGAAQMIADHRAQEIRDVAAKAAACQALGIASAGFAGEGAAIHQPAPAHLAAALTAARQTGEAAEWTIVSNRRSSVELLESCGCRAAFTNEGASYIGNAPAQA